MYPDFCRLRLDVPSIDKQALIVGHIKNETEFLGKAISRTEREIELLREYRTTLTAEVVTGKLDVREAAKQLPVESEEPLPAEDKADDGSEETDDVVE